MKNLVRVAMLVVAFASACCAQEAVVNVSSKGKQKWSPSEVDTVYLAACTAVQREFGDSIVLRPPVALVLGAETNAVDFDKKTILLKRWDHTLFAQGVVVLAFEDLPYAPAADDDNKPCSELGSSHCQHRRDRQVTVWQSVTVLTLRSTRFASTTLSKQGRPS